MLKNMTEEKNVSEVIEKKSAGVAKAGWPKMVGWGLVVLIIVIAGMQVAIADKYKAQVAVIAGEKKVGVNPTTAMLDFGDLSGDTSATRLVTMKASGMDTFVHISKFGSASQLFKVSENNFVMKKGDNKKLEFAMYMPPSAPVGAKYTGWVYIFKIPKFW